jgi:hypothetical protein
MTIKVVSKKHDSIEELGMRELVVKRPNVLKCETLDEFKEVMGETFCASQITNQLKIMFRSHVRSKMDSTNDDDSAFNFSDDEIESIDFSDWKPQARTRVSAQDKAMAILGKLDPATLADVLAKAQEQAA